MIIIIILVRSSRQIGSHGLDSKGEDLVTVGLEFKFMFLRSQRFQEKTGMFLHFCRVC